MMQSMIQRSVLSTTASKIRYTAAIRCSTSSIAASSWADTNSKHFRQEVKHRDANPVLLTLTAQQQQSSSFSSSSEKSTKQRMIPRKAALHLTPKAREVHRRCYHFAPSFMSLQCMSMQYYEEDKSRRKKTSTIKRDLSTTNNKSVINVLSKEAATAPIDYPTSQRFLALPPAIGIHLAIGSVYVYSMWTPGMSKALGERIHLFRADHCKKGDYCALH